MENNSHQREADQVPSISINNSFALKQDDNLKQNGRVREKIFQCHICLTYRTAFRGNLDKHIRTHTGEKPYQCRVCGKLFSSQSNKKSHEDRHATNSGRRCYVSCPVHSCKFSTMLGQSHLKIHMLHSHSLNSSHPEHAQSFLQEGMSVGPLSVTNGYAMNCPVDQCLFSTSGGADVIRQHMKSVHLDEPSNQSFSHSGMFIGSLVNSVASTLPTNSSNLINSAGVMQSGSKNNGLAIEAMAMAALHKAAEKVHQDENELPQVEVIPDEDDGDLEDIKPVLNGLVETCGSVTYKDQATKECIDLLVKDNKIFRCNHCNILFPDYGMFVFHMGSHGVADPFQCHHCQEIFADKFAFQAHFMQCLSH